MDKTTQAGIQLDPTKLLGFTAVSAGTENGGRSATAKIGEKIGTKVGTKVGGKVGVKVGAKAGKPTA